MFPLRRTVGGAREREHAPFVEDLKRIHARAEHDDAAHRRAV